MKKTIEEVLLKATEGVAKMGSISQPKLQVLASTFPIPENAGEVKEALERYINTMKTPHEQCAEEIRRYYSPQFLTEHSIESILSKHFPQLPTSTPSLDALALKAAHHCHAGATFEHDAKFIKQAILEYNASLTAENGKQIKSVVAHWSEMAENAYQERDEALAKLAEATKDKERLDWLENQDDCKIFRFTTGAKLRLFEGGVGEYFIDTSNLRTAIDSAMKGGNP